jgi:putative inorganic carbon (HCO3(-)) transporter
MIWFLAIVLAFAPLYLIRFKILNLPTTLLEILIVGFLIVSLFSGKIKDKKAKIKELGLINWAIGLFVLSGIIGMIVSPEPIRALGLLRAFIIEPILIFYAVILTVKNKGHVNILLQAVFWFAVLVSAFGLFQYTSFIHLPIKFWGYGEEPRRIVSIFAHPNALSLYLAPLFGLFMTLLINNYPLMKNRWIARTGLLLMGLALLLTYSRGAWLAAAIGGLIILVQKFGIKKVILPTVGAVVLLLLVPSINQRLGRGLSDPSSSAHGRLMMAGLNKIIESPIIGNGLYGFRTTLTEINFQEEIHNFPHNIILSIWVELGLIGILAFAWIVNLALKQYKNNPKLIPFAAAVFVVVVLIHGLVDTPYLKNDLALLFWFALSLLYVKIKTQ